MPSTFYPRDILDNHEKLAAEYPRIEAKVGIKVLHRASKFRGVISYTEKDTVTVKSSNSGLERIFTMTPGAFAIDGETVTLIKPKIATKSPGTTNSGSIAVADQKARVAQASRIYVEGIHDASLVEKVWGDDLRAEGIVVERLDGIDDLAGIVRSFEPNKQRRLGILVDHLVPNSKETRIVETIKSPYVAVTGTPYVDVWQAIRPKTLGIEAWPEIPKGTDWKLGICAAFGETDPRVMWRKLLASVNSWTDLEPSFIGAVEQLIDFVTLGE